MYSIKYTSILLFAALFIFSTSCEKKLGGEEEKLAELLYKFDSDSSIVYYFEDCDEMTIDSMTVEEGVLFTFTGCGQTVKYISQPDWYYNCYPVYDYWGYYLYDDCYWEYYPQLDIEKDSLVSSFVLNY